MQKEIIEKGNLHREKGVLNEIGWSRNLLLDYDRKLVKAPGFLIKEWDYYAVLNDKFGVALTIADNGYLGFISATFFDFSVPEEHTKTIMTVMPLGKFKMPGTSERGNVTYENKEVTIDFIKEDEQRILKFSIKNFHENKSFTGDVILHQPRDMESITIVTPFTKKNRFYYNQKINCMKASGKITFNDREYDFENNESYGVLDWGRGVWTYENTWYWSSASGKLNGELFGFNLGYGFGDTSSATENAVFYQGKVNKLGHVEFIIPEDSYLDNWKITSDDHRIELMFEPVIDRNSSTKVLFLGSDQHQVFGYFSGKIILDDFREILLDRFFGFAEKVFNKW
ncbi:MAG: DUF2804 domain-containing protein [Clostridia bacterium]|nr:DUF2804 domain-containing protein [Clostridia bacterium]